MGKTNLPTEQRGTAGRPSYSDAVRQKVLNGLRQGMTRAAASGWAGISRATLYDWIEKDADYRASVLQAEDDAEARYTATVKVMSGPTAPHAVRLRASEFWLSRRRPADWRERTTIDLNLPPEAEEAKREIDDLRSELHALGEELLGRGASRAGSARAGRDPGEGSS
jgi:hypothetical protein